LWLTIKQRYKRRTGTNTMNQKHINLLLDLLLINSFSIKDQLKTAEGVGNLYYIKAIEELARLNTEATEELKQALIKLVEQPSSKIIIKHQ
jgi:hypothetical protein